MRSVLLLGLLAQLASFTLLMLSCSGECNEPTTADVDGDGIPNISDTDDDNDGIPDVSDDFPYHKGAYSIGQ